MTTAPDDPAPRWVELCRFPEGPVRVGTFARIAVALGWDLDDVTVHRDYNHLALARREDATADRPAIGVWFPEHETVDPAVAESDADELDADEPDPEPGADEGDDDPPAERQWEVFQPPQPTTRTCSLCPRVLETVGAREVHETRDHGPGSVPCPDCGGVYATQAGCDRHRRSKHPDAAVEIGNRFCVHCRREFASADAARTHETRDHAAGGAPLGMVCDECAQVFANNRGLEHHTTLKHRPAERSA